VPFTVARDQKISAIFYGECPNNQYGEPEGKRDHRVMTQKWASEFAGFLGVRAEDFEGVEGITSRDMDDYKAPSEKELEDVTAYFLGWFEPWNSHKNADAAIKSGMKYLHPGKMNWWGPENQDNYQVAIHDHAMYRKYGYGRLVAQISVDIRDGLISREDALEVVKERDGLFPHVYLGMGFGQICSHMGMNEIQAKETFDQFTNWELFGGVEHDRPIVKED
jgi:hypothetical protein